MVACGAQARNAYCQAHNLCSANGNAIVAYADSLVQSVNNHELSEAEARRKWIEFRAARVEAQQQILAAQAAARAASSTTCNKVGNSVICN